LLNILRELQYSNIFLAKIGQASYSMYIFHFIFVWYLLPTIGLVLEKVFSPEILLACAMILATGLTFLIAKISQKYIEDPGIWLGRRLISKL
jgi:peptidoglycan/LPS O-acetylase OafA/YrhL